MTTSGDVDQVAEVRPQSETAIQNPAQLL